MITFVPVLIQTQIEKVLMRGVNRSADRRIWPLKAHGLWISAINRADSWI